jgi:hypothetical protein
MDMLYFEIFDSGVKFLDQIRHHVEIFEVVQSFKLFQVFSF